ncbi:MAG: RecX family transcriptional regulator [Candidatus Woesebacteria bacterium]|jgi:regulatory protein
MKITAIKAQVKNPDRVSVYVDEKYSFSLNCAQLLDLKLCVGLEVDQAKLDEFKKASDFGKLYERLMRYALLRPRSVYEIEQYCRRKKYVLDDCREIIQKLITRGYVNDEQFSKSWVENRRLNKSVSVKRLRLELRQKGVSSDIVDQVLSESEYNEQAALQDLIAKKRRQTKYHDDQKLLQYLARQGFGYDDIKQAL